MDVKVNRLGPALEQAAVAGGADNAAAGVASVDFVLKVDRAGRPHRFNDRLGKSRPSAAVQFVEIKSLCLPVFVQAKREVERRLPLQPGDMGADLRRNEVAVVAVEVEAAGIFARVRRQADGIEQRTNQPDCAGVEKAAFEQAQQREGRRRLVAMDAGGKIDPRARTRRAPGQGEEREAGNFAEFFDAKTGGQAGGVELRGHRQRIEGG